MNFLTYRSSLQKQMNEYIDYLPFIKHEKGISDFEIEIFTFKLLDNLTRSIWNGFIAIPKNEKGSFQLSPSRLRKIISETIKNEAN